MNNIKIVTLERQNLRCGNKESSYLGKAESKMWKQGKGRKTQTKYSQLSLSRLRLSRITAFLEQKIWSLFKHRNLKSGYKILCKRGEIAPVEQFLPFCIIFSIYISN